MIAGCCSGGTGCYANHCNCVWTDTTYAPKATIRIHPGSTVSKTVTVTQAELTPKEALKAEMRKQCREESLQAHRELAEFHDQEQLLDGHQRRQHHRRPTKRRTCTAVQNFRGRP